MSELTEAIASYLQEGHGQDYESGYALFCKASHNWNLKDYLRRHPDPAVLRYQLERCLTFLTAAPTPAVSPAPKTTDAERSLDRTTEDAVAVHRTFDERLSRRSELPEDLQIQYDRNTIDYHKIRTLHEKMKLATNDADRASLRSQVIDLADAVRRRWDAIDAWLDGDKEKEEIWNESSVMKYLYKMSAKESLNEAQLNLVAKRYRQCCDRGVDIKPKIRERIEKTIRR